MMPAINQMWLEPGVDVDSLPSDVHTFVSKNLGIDPGDEASAIAISKMTPREVLGRFLAWHGIHGYTETLP